MNPIYAPGYVKQEVVKARAEPTMGLAAPSAAVATARVVAHGNGHTQSSNAGRIVPHMATESPTMATLPRGGAYSSFSPSSHYPMQTQAPSSYSMTSPVKATIATQREIHSAIIPPTMAVVPPTPSSGMQLPQMSPMSQAMTQISHMTLQQLSPLHTGFQDSMLSPPYSASSSAYPQNPYNLTAAGAPSPAVPDHAFFVLPGTGVSEDMTMRTDKRKNSRSELPAPYPGGSLKMRRKFRKNTREKQRRLELNDQFESLCTLLNLNNKSKTEKFTILSEAIQVIGSLREENVALRREKTELRTEMGKLASCLQSAFPDQPDLITIPPSPSHQPQQPQSQQSTLPQQQQQMQQQLQQQQQQQPPPPPVLSVMPGKSDAIASVSFDPFLAMAAPPAGGGSSSASAPFSFSFPQSHHPAILPDDEFADRPDSVQELNSDLNSELPDEDDNDASPDDDPLHDSLDPLETNSMDELEI